MPIPAACPECGAMEISVTSVPPNEHEYAGWQTKIKCEECDTELFEPEIEQ
jgi:hypothetical protein